MGIRKIENGAAHDRERKDECKKTETKDLMRRKRKIDKDSENDKEKNRKLLYTNFLFQLSISLITVRWFNPHSILSLVVRVK